MQELRIGPGEAGQRLDKYLKKALPNAPMGLLFKQLRNKNVTLNKKKAEGKELLKDGDVIQCFFRQETYEQFAGLSQESDQSSEYLEAFQSLKGISVLYEDDNYLFLIKPAGILSQKATANDQSVNEWMIGHLLNSGATTKEALKLLKPSVANRLDRNTSGIVLCGKSLMGLQSLSFLLRERLMEKHYQAICHGSLSKECLIEGYLLKDEKTNQVQIFSESREGADPIQTRYVPLASNAEYTLLDVELITGKTHQIRAHLSSIGHPLAGDAKYAPSELFQKDRAKFSLTHQLLHAEHVSFPKWEELPEAACPYEKALRSLCEKTFTAPLPNEFSRIKQKLFS